MKKIRTLVAALAIVTMCIASSGYISLPKKAADIFTSSGNNMKNILNESFNYKYQKLSSKNLNFVKGLSFKIGQKKVK